MVLDCKKKLRLGKNNNRRSKTESSLKKASKGEWCTRKGRGWGTRETKRGAKCRPVGLPNYKKERESPERVA